MKGSLRMKRFMCENKEFWDIVLHFMGGKKIQ